MAKIQADDGISLKISDWMKKLKNFLIITGPAGTGKTYLCAAMMAHLKQKVNHFRAYNERELLKRIREGFSDSSSGDYIDHLHYLIDDQLIIIDDFGSSGHTDWREEVLFEAIDFRYNSMLPTIITSNLSKDEVYSTYGQRIHSRMFAKENTIIDMEGLPDMREYGD
jgi:DNA replication protein DnaC